MSSPVAATLLEVGSKDGSYAAKPSPFVKIKLEWPSSPSLNDVVMMSNRARGAFLF
ncbi:hypothetical protein K8I31_15315 [bacterium]|nr:hypothetical protein [bacterium]